MNSGCWRDRRSCACSANVMRQRPVRRSDRLASGCVKLRPCWRRRVKSIGSWSARPNWSRASGNTPFDVATKKITNSISSSSNSFAPNPAVTAITPPPPPPLWFRLNWKFAERLFLRRPEWQAPHLVHRYRHLSDANGTEPRILSSKIILTNLQTRTAQQDCVFIFFCICLRFVEDKWKSVVTAMEKEQQILRGDCQFLLELIIRFLTKLPQSKNNNNTSNSWSSNFKVCCLILPHIFPFLKCGSYD